MKPQNSTPYIEKADRDKANSIAPALEAVMMNFSKEHYQFKVIIERWTDLIWYAKEKLLFNSSGRTLFEVTLVNYDSEIFETAYGLKGLTVRVHFLETNSLARETKPSPSQIDKFTNTLQSVTKTSTIYVGKQGLFRD